jgi:hypothetical protein
MQRTKSFILTWGSGGGDDSILPSDCWNFHETSHLGGVLHTYKYDLPASCIRQPPKHRSSSQAPKFNMFSLKITLALAFSLVVTSMASPSEYLHDRAAAAVTYSVYPGLNMLGDDVNDFQSSDLERSFTFNADCGQGFQWRSLRGLVHEVLQQRYGQHTYGWLVLNYDLTVSNCVGYTYAPFASSASTAHSVCILKGKVNPDNFQSAATGKHDVSLGLRGKCGT